MALSPKELAERWGRSEEVIRRHCQAGQLRAFKIGKLWRIPMTVILALENGEAPAEIRPNTYFSGAAS
jgi:excisionase family DNA binding protein